ncbi:iron-sulfur cluster assembly scaffold protein [Candidatus Saccharibacteria bacterium]|nr:iron-sulfur cluster assembly scaffold protein [Candidatus Saccharibacteria bacterium]
MSNEKIKPFAYTEIVKDHFLNPRNFLMGDEKNFAYDAKGTVGNPVCGDQMNMYLKISSRKNPETNESETYIKDIKWKTYGCASAIASTSALSELAKGKTLEEAEKISAKEICDFLGGLPEHKFHCSVLGHEALKDAIKNHQEKGSPKTP